MQLNEVFSDSDVSDYVLSIQNVAYEEADSIPIVHLFCRNADKEFVHIEAVGHYPSFYVKTDMWNDRLAEHPTVKNYESGYTSLHGTELTKVYLKQPSYLTQYGDGENFTDRFQETWEADVSYESRFLIDTELYTVLTFDESDIQQQIGDNHYKLHYTDLEAYEEHEDEYVKPRIGTIDIEVAAKDGFPEPEDAEVEVTTVVAHDSYSDEYTSWALRSDHWENEDLSDTRVFDDEKSLLNDLNCYIESKRFDVLSGWNSNGFDYPYLINRCKNLGVWNVYDWSPLGEVYVSSRGDCHIEGVTTLDMLDGYKKTQTSTLKKGTLEYVATKELGEGKVAHVDDIPDDTNEYLYMWQHEIETFIEYNHRDVEAVVEIDNSIGITELFVNLRHLSGVRFSNVEPPINMIDVMVLREAQKQNIVLPTATKPKDDWYYGAWVKTPQSGLHTNVIYPDLSSLYPNTMLQCNISPEVKIGTAEQLEKSNYTEDDCVWSYIDTRSDAVKEDTNPQYEKCYFLKHEIEKGFITNVVDTIMTLNDLYRGTDLYMASKVVRNALYGVVGDSNSFGTGFRLFDKHCAESITLGGRKVIQYSMDEFISYLNENNDVGNDEAYCFAGDTDSVMTALPFADSGEKALSVAQEAAEYLNQSYEQFVEDTFGSTHNYMEIEVESYGSSCFYPEDLSSQNGIKKRYAQMIEWDDDDYWLDESELKIKGFDYVRGDTANITADLQYTVLHTILDTELTESEKRGKIVSHVRDTVTQIRENGIDKSEYGIPFGIGQSLDEYGSVDRTPMPKYRGAKYANDYIYETDAISEGDKPLYYYISRVNGYDHPKHYKSDTKEDGNNVDAVSVLEASDLPDNFVVDTEKMIEKTVTDPLERIFKAMGWQIGDVLVESDQSDIMQFM